MIDRNELEDQLLRISRPSAWQRGARRPHRHAQQAAGRERPGLSRYRRHHDHKFRDMPAKLNTRKNIFVLIDEAHRTTGGDLGNFLMAGLPNASFIGFTGTPVDKTVYGKARSRPSAARMTRLPAQILNR